MLLLWSLHASFHASSMLSKSPLDTPNVHTPNSRASSRTRLLGTNALVIFNPNFAFRRMHFTCANEFSFFKWLKSGFKWLFESSKQGFTKQCKGIETSSNTLWRRLDGLVRTLKLKVRTFRKKSGFFSSRLFKIEQLYLLHFSHTIQWWTRYSGHGGQKYSDDREHFTMWKCYKVLKNFQMKIQRIRLMVETSRDYTPWPQQMEWCLAPSRRREVQSLNFSGVKQSWAYKSNWKVNKFAVINFDRLVIRSSGSVRNLLIKVIYRSLNWTC